MIAASRRWCWLVLLWCSSISAAEPAWKPLLEQVDVTQGAISGRWSKSDAGLSVQAAQGARFALPLTPKGEYDVRVSFTRRTGQHSVGLLIPYGGQQVAFEVDAWGQHLAGFQNIAGKNIQNNPTRRENVALDNNRRYTLLIEVRKDLLRALLDDQELARLATNGSDLAVSDLWKMPDRDHLALLAWDSETVFHTVDWRQISGTSPATVLPPVAARKTSPPTGTPATPKTAAVPSNPARKSETAPATGKRVLIVIANHHFFYREYSEPRAELEKAGMRVTVAAGRKAPCRPHPGTGEGADGGLVQPDLALSDVKAANFDAILFSGGWGASAYQFAFSGRYQDAAYNGERPVKLEANRVINEFVAADKYVCGLCNGVSVLAWARVNGRSPLSEKRVCAPSVGAPPGMYPGRRDVPLCRWHPEVNGAQISPAGSIGQAGTPVDDVLVDGKIITGEDDPSAREMGRRIVQVLSTAK